MSFATQVEKRNEKELSNYCENWFEFSRTNISHNCKTYVKYEHIVPIKKTNLQYAPKVLFSKFAGIIRPIYEHSCHICDSIKNAAQINIENVWRDYNISLHELKNGRRINKGDIDILDKFSSFICKYVGYHEKTGYSVSINSFITATFYELYDTIKLKTLTPIPIKNKCFIPIITSINQNNVNIGCKTPQSPHKSRDNYDPFI